MKLDHLYSLRRNFTVIGLTGRTGSGCTTMANLLSGSYSNLEKEGLRNFSDEMSSNGLFIRKYNIIKNFVSTDSNWTPFDVISYKNVLLLYLFNRYGGNYYKLYRLLKDFYRVSKKEDNESVVSAVHQKILKIHVKYSPLIAEIKSIENLGKIKKEDDLILLNKIFFGKSFNSFSNEIFKALQSEGYYRRTNFLHHIACNIRQSGDPRIPNGKTVENIYQIANVINRIVKARKLANKERPTRIVIDSLRNSLEIMFFRERYSAFYMLATKDVMDNSRDRILKRLPKSIKDVNEREVLADKLLELDEIEYKTGDFAKGLFSSPDVENCIQKSDYHILNLKESDIPSFIKKYDPPFEELNFLTREEQLLKLVALISQPGLVTPSSVERSMQVANSAKLNSGCISRNVGAAITDNNFYVKSIGWNDVAKGHTPCNLREVNDIIKPSNPKQLEKSKHYSPFEKGEVSSKSSYKYKNEKPSKFNEALQDYFETAYKKNGSDLKGKNCAFCFKTVHNHYEGEANQVHTRSLHAEENAMLQITKLGGQGVENGILFTTASPCELCSKKAYQLGIKKIYFIDPYPGISNDQILKGGQERTKPKMIPFSGAIGIAYHKLYDSFMSYKDEVSMTLEIKSNNKIGIQFKQLLKSLSDNDDVRNLLESRDKFSDDDVKEIIKKALS
ncbi:hypothetical protein C7H62_2375 [Mesoflavibacter sp. HG96]|uniref:hypothetical protein n=1 Tax=unclassified Mesoflavibacter TaxID=2630131 RepID=UPI000D0F9993|nr:MULTISPECIES: hypothetical protein [unclassified Mesoflavibacter]QIJ90183.1 hypothetical protein C7H62_2375 [Mesoflavibacter sp. HG96]QIJ92911.1 hypothetical protein C7H56_2375 [Mesoflavibacter sp. HG37]